MTKSAELYQKAQTTIPGGVNSPVRAFNGVGGSPIFIDRADGALILMPMVKHTLTTWDHGDQ